MEVFTKLVSFIRVARGGSHRMVSIIEGRTSIGGRRETEAPRGGREKEETTH
jgi:hypothetical protein